MRDLRELKKSFVIATEHTFEYRGSVVDFRTCSAARLQQLANDPQCRYIAHKPRSAKERKAAVLAANTLRELDGLLDGETAKTVLSAGNSRRSQLQNLNSDN